MLAISAEGSLAACPASEELFKRAAGFRSKRVHYHHGLYENLWKKGDAAVREIATSFKRRRTTFSDTLKERALLLEKCCAQVEESAGSGTSKPKGKSKSRAKPKSKAR